jgi:hypothetical protein
MELTYGARHLDRVIDDPVRLLSAFTDEGRRYLDYQPLTPRERLVPEDLAVTILINSRVSWRAFMSVQDHGDTVDLAQLTPKPLEQTDERDRALVAEVIAQVATWPGFGASVTTKILHKKRPDLIPILDNQAIFGAYMNPKWPGSPALMDTVKSRPRIAEALEWIAADVTRPENSVGWRAVQAQEPERTRIDLFDMVWWSYFRAVEPAGAVKTPI